MAVILGVSMIFFANAHSLLVAILLVIPTGFAYVGIAVSSNTQVQTLSEDAMLGRVMAFYPMGALGSPPLGAFLLGYISALIGLSQSFLIDGACLSISAPHPPSSLLRP